MNQKPRGDGASLPFPQTPSSSVAGRTLAESRHRWRQDPQRLPEDAPNIVIFISDDAGFSNPDTFGGPVHMPTMHGPHHVPQEWADKYKGTFDEGWEVLRQETFKRQKELGWIPADTELTPIDESMQRWADVPAEQRAFQTRLMEVYAGFLEHTDAQYGKVVDELAAHGLLANTIIIYINSDNGASAEGMNGTISELLAQNSMASTVEEQLDVLEREYDGATPENAAVARKALSDVATLGFDASYAFGRKEEVRPVD